MIGRGTCSATTASTPSSASTTDTASAKRAGGASPRTSTGLARGISWRQQRVERLRRVLARTARGARPRSTALSAASMPGPRPFDTIASRSPRGMRPSARMRAAANSCVYVRTRTVPARSSAASNTRSGAIAGSPSASISGTALVRAARLQHHDGLRARGLAQRRHERARVAHASRRRAGCRRSPGSCTSASSSSPKPTSMPAAERYHGREADRRAGPRSRASRCTPRPTGRRARAVPGRAIGAQKVALRPMSVRTTPNAPGPSRRMPCLRAAARGRRAPTARAAAPSPSENDSTTAARSRPCVASRMPGIVARRCGDDREIDRLADARDRRDTRP